ncbi:hypothetical protein N7539_005905 [Penicillium diatomitis]|uniref:CFEM domain-containing protein n=1 Tax=Penicillium diatomitis TaxID=2819901 RepID=A0A9W9X5B0_9EURO|nr:uncharacterized protein N7539_005905 [Penicillium diatomitis]KAJ5484109.1 hypothetical protein N7539_005905 [Penicillium diatomitis]
MRPQQCLLVCLTLLVCGVQAVNFEFETNTFPSCTLTCDTQLTTSNCSLATNESCFCQHADIASSVLDCAEAHCSVKDYFTTYRLYEDVCNIPKMQGPPLVSASTLIPTILAIFFFFARIYAKAIGLGGGWGWDDYTIIVSFILGIAFYAGYTLTIVHGSGMNIWDIPFDHINQFYQSFQAIAIMYKIQISLAKISVCLFLLRIFHARPFRYTAYLLILANASIGLCWAFVDSFRCIPTRLTWLGWQGEESGRCINFIVSILVNCLANIAVDSVLILLPVFEVVKLQLPLKKKIAVATMFAVGSVLTVVAIIRAVVFWRNRWGVNQTKGLYPLLRWSLIEVEISVMCACLPAFRALIGRFFPALVGSERRTYATHTMEGYSRHTGHPSNINKSVSYSVNYHNRSETHSVVELVDVNGKERV